MLRRRVVSTVFIAVCLGLIISLIVNDVYSKRISREHQYTHMLYNHLMVDVYDAYPPQSSFPGFQRAAVNMAYAASVLNDLYSQASIVDNENTTTTSVIQEDANFVSYIALALVRNNDTYMVNGRKNSITITPQQAKNLVIKISHIIFKNVVHGFDIPDAKIGAVYHGIYGLIPNDFKTMPGGDPFNLVFYH